MRSGEKRAVNMNGMSEDGDQVAVYIWTIRRPCTGMIRNDIMYGMWKVSIYKISCKSLFGSDKTMY